MNLESNINVRIQGFRSIDEINLKIDGISVLAGENGSGKSTVSKLVYFIFNMASKFETLVLGKLKLDLTSVNSFLEIIIFEIGREDRKNRHEWNRELRNLKNRLELEHLDFNLRSDYLLLLHNISGFFEENGNLKVSSSRISMILKDILGEKNVENNTISFQKIINRVEGIFKKNLLLLEKRDIIIVKEKLNELFEDELPSKMEVSEYNDIIFSLENSNISIPYTIQNAVYFDTPMMLGERFSDHTYWDDTNSLIEKKGNNNTNNYITNIIASDILKGDVSYDEEYLSGYEFLYKRFDGLAFNLLEVATGIKSFSILQLLLKNNTINDKSLIIIDEPESHLHPQWIVEYARLIVLINKYIGAKFLLASHNPDMISALRYITEKEETLTTTNFYLAKKKSDFSYNYQYLDKDIEPIFESFNIALDRIEKYGI
jgi:predicted ATP-dependent endonuclease of OLD family